MYLIELNDIDIERAISDAEYFTASEDEYFSAEGSKSSYLIPSSSRTAYSMRSSSINSSVRSVTLQKKQFHTMPSENTKINWTFDESEPREKYSFRKHIPVDAAGMRNYYIWRRIVLSGVHPREAAHMAGSKFCFKQVKQKKKNQLHSIRLNIEHRVFFIIQENERIVKVLNIGGHSFC
ncbi:hypothetical protein ACLMPM_24060 [Yersinia enterocolitica]|uniref:hypothetical protein n=1 Tax=Yersinia enterocolitica TaxID=630 RepID=UPI00398CEE14